MGSRGAGPEPGTLRARPEGRLPPVGVWLGAMECSCTGLFMRKVRTILRYLGTCDGNMEQGSLRCDVNIYVRHPGDALGTRAEITNINSVRFVHQAIEYETRRQIKEFEGGGDVALETRRFDPRDGVTHPMRSKEEAHDYRYFPRPRFVAADFHPGVRRQHPGFLAGIARRKKGAF